jgi:aminoglycoside/choline kinase family phosphotransferase
MLNDSARKFLDATGWRDATIELLTGDASARKYARVKKGNRTAILMNASQLPEIVAPFIQIDRHLIQFGFSAPEILACDDVNSLLLLEDFGDATFAQLLDAGHDPEKLFALGTDVLIALHKNPLAVPKDLRAYSPEKMLEDLELFLDWCTPGISEAGKAEFRKVWREILPVAHQVPVSLLLRDYHVANLMLLPARDSVRRAGLLDFQDAYMGPVTYDLVSLLEDARRDVPEDLKQKMFARYLAQFPSLDRDVFGASTAILAALRHTRVLAIFEKLSRTEEKHDYKNLHSPRVEHLLQNALRHPTLAGVRRWLAQYVRQN